MAEEHFEARLARIDECTKFILKGQDELKSILVKNTVEVDELKTAKNKIYGALAMLSTVGSSLGALLIKHITMGHK